ncbi:Trm112 family protein [Salipiger bermudensis]|uniref:Trm112 family protein n=1 Tax=Salipiger bermudensis TaxID=344736 RepID=UPI001CD50B85|nr:Trm112 family protein [Salipiger bermudensis]MCA0963637.1 Trm112 family protein [Salipiger bermudensis]
MTEAETSPAAFDRRMLEALVCPATQNRLKYDAERQELISKGAGLAYPIREGIPVMLVDEARRIDD